MTGCSEDRVWEPYADAVPDVLGRMATLFARVEGLLEVAGVVL